MPTIQYPMRFKYPRISYPVIQHGYKPHLPARERHRLLEQFIEMDRQGAKGVWYKLDQLIFTNDGLKSAKVFTRDRNWVRKNFLPYRWDYNSGYVFPHY